MRRLRVEAICRVRWEARLNWQALLLGIYKSVSGSAIIVFSFWTVVSSSLLRSREFPCRVCVCGGGGVLGLGLGFGICVNVTRRSKKF